MSAASKHSRTKKRGFTIIELLVAMTLLVVIVSIVYATFTAVLNSTEDAREAAARLRMTQFLTRSFTRNLAEAKEGWLPGATLRYAQRTGNDLVAEGMGLRYQFRGTNQEGPYGPADSLVFASTAPLVGSTALPGWVKQVSYSVSINQPDGEGLDFESTAPPEAVLDVSETPILGDPEGYSLNLDAAAYQDAVAQSAADFGVVAPSWSLPIQSLNIRYFDGKEWRDEWDAMEEGRLPWTVDIRINFVRPEDSALEREFRVATEDDEESDYRLVFSLPTGVGVRDEPPYRWTNQE